MHARTRSFSLWVTVALLASGLAALPATPARATSWFCSDGVAPPCVVSATLNGAEVPSNDPDWAVMIVPHNHDGFKDALWSVSRYDSAHMGDDSLDDVWRITFDVGTVIPRVAFMRGKDGNTIRTDDGDGTYKVSVRGTPVVVSAGCSQASWPWTCPEVATSEWNGYLDGQITNYGGWEDPVQRNAMYGMNYYTNIDATELPPQVVSDPETGTDYLSIALANPHFRMDEQTLARGFFNMEIPNAFLREVYGIDAPATLTANGLAPTIGSGTVTVAQSADDDSMLVDASDITFSMRRLRVKRGVITPTRPTAVRASRPGVHRGKVAFDAARARGSRITGYRAECVARRGDHVVTARADASPIIVSELRDGVGYDCRVRAGSLAGPGRWSEPDGMSGQA